MRLESPQQRSGGRSPAALTDSMAPWEEGGLWRWLPHLEEIDPHVQAV